MNLDYVKVRRKKAFILMSSIERIKYFSLSLGGEEKNYATADNQF